MKLYGYWRSSAAYRVRIALNLKGLDYRQVPVNLAPDASEQQSAAYGGLNPQKLVPVLELADGTRLIQSLAIIDYLEETVPDPPLLPVEPSERARVRGLAQAVACDLHPLNNLRVLRYLQTALGLDPQSRNAWYAHWVAEGLAALEALVDERPPGPFCHGERPGMADICLVPQLYNARRFNVPLDAYPTLVAIDAACRPLPAFQAALPESQPDAPV